MYRQSDEENPHNFQRYGGDNNLAMPHFGDKFPFCIKMIIYTSIFI